MEASKCGRLILDIAGKKSGSTAAQKARSDATTEGVTSDLKTLKVDDAPLPKSKNLNVVSEFERTKTKKSASFVVVGQSTPVVTV